MGNTTILEINHDYWNEINENKEEFANQVIEQLGQNKYEGKYIIGGRVICMFHRHDSDISRAWEKFKTKFMPKSKDFPDAG